MSTAQKALLERTVPWLQMLLLNNKGLDKEQMLDLALLIVEIKSEIS